MLLKEFSTPEFNIQKSPEIVEHVAGTPMKVLDGILNTFEIQETITLSTRVQQHGDERISFFPETFVNWDGEPHFFPIYDVLRQ